MKTITIDYKEYTKLQKDSDSLKEILKNTEPIIVSNTSYSFMGIERDTTSVFSKDDILKIFAEMIESDKQNIIKLNNEISDLRYKLHKTEKKGWFK